VQKAFAVARELNQRGLRYRTGGAWTKDLVLSVVGQTAAIGTYFWGKRRANRPRPQEEWLPLVVDPIVDREVFDLVQLLRQSRDPASSPGRGVAKPHLLTGLLRCAKCGASYQLETSGKKVDCEAASELQHGSHRMGRVSRLEGSRREPHL
jgi:site-specific DNA recombinase